MIGWLFEKITVWLWIKWMTLNGVYTAEDNLRLVVKTLMLILLIAYVLDSDWRRVGFQALLLLAVEGIDRLDKRLKAKEKPKDEQ